MPGPVSSATPPVPRSPARLVVLKPCCLGDLVQATAVLAALHDRWHDAPITVGSGRWSLPAVAHHPAVAATFDLGNAGVRGRQRPADLLRLWRALRRGRFDLAVVPDRSPVLCLLTFLAAIPARAGLDSGGRGRLYTVRAAPLPRAHELDQAARLLAQLGIRALPLPRVYPGPEGEREAAALAATLPTGRPLALLAPGGGENPGTTMPSKRWDPAGFAALAQALQADGLAPVLVGAASDRAAAAAVLAAAPELLDWTGRTSVAGLAALAGRARLYVGNDSGTTHLAAAAGCPTVAVFGPTAPALYGPRGRWVRALAPDPSRRSGGSGSVRDPYRFAGAWQPLVETEHVIAAAHAALAAERPCD